MDVSRTTKHPQNGRSRKRMIDSSSASSSLDTLSTTASPSSSAGVKGLHMVSPTTSSSSSVGEFNQSKATQKTILREVTDDSSSNTSSTCNNRKRSIDVKKEIIILDDSSSDSNNEEITTTSRKMTTVKKEIIILNDDDNEELSGASQAKTKKVKVENVVVPEKSNSNADVRRSKRERKSTTIKVGQHTILAQNNYVVKGMTYSFGVADENKNNPNSILMTPATPPSSKVSKPRSPRALTGVRLERSKHNEKVKQSILRDEIERKKFMSKNFSTLEPFLEDKVKLELKSFCNKNYANNPVKEAPKKVNMQPDLVLAEMRDYQMDGLSWMVNMHDNGMPMILGDEMGLGKTLQTISLLCYLKERSIIPDDCSSGNSSKKSKAAKKAKKSLVANNDTVKTELSGPSLVVCPLSVLYSWCNEIKKWAPSLKYLRFHASDKVEQLEQKSTLLRDALQYDVVVTTYEMIKNPNFVGLFRLINFNYVILDEGHIIKDISTQISAAVRRINSRNKLLLTGTPLQNNLTELYAILNYLYPQYFTTDINFKNAFQIGTHSVVDPDMLLKANKMLSIFMIRRLKEQVEKLMPKKIETKVICPLSSFQKYWYKGLIMKDIDLLANAQTDFSIPVEDDEVQVITKPTVSKTKYNRLRNLVMQLRKCCLHPFLFDGAEVNIEETTLEELIAGSGKLSVLDKLLQSLFIKGNRTVIFSQFTTMLDILEDYCVLRKWKYVRFDGGTPRARRNYLINKFNAKDSAEFIFLMSTRSGGLGINLQTADTCILYDSDWNPQPDLQAMARVHRIGQKKTVHVYRLVSGGTVEERVLERAERKLYLDRMVNTGIDGANEDQKKEGGGAGLTTDELLKTLTFGSNAIFKSSNNLPTEEDIDHITDRSRKENVSLGEKLKGGTTQTAKDFDFEKELTSTTQLNGVDFGKIRKEQESKKEDIPKSMKKLQEQLTEKYTAALDETGGRGKRQKFSRIKMVDGMGSGYGMACVPVLAQNNYSLEHGEMSVYAAKETVKTIGCIEPKKKNKKKHFDENQDFCQFCGEGGTLILCPLCPISVHERCCGQSATGWGGNAFSTCTHHHCVNCNRNTTGAAGLLFACESCPNSWCEDCLPTSSSESDFKIRFLGETTPRFQKLGLEGRQQCVYIHCSRECENIAITEFGWKLEESNRDDNRADCLKKINVSYAFGEKALSVEQIYALKTGKRNRSD